MFIAHVHHFIPMVVLALIIGIPIYDFVTTHSMLEVCNPRPQVITAQETTRILSSRMQHRL